MAGRLLSTRRSRLDDVYIEIFMYLNVNFELIPYHIPPIDVKDVFMHFPIRLADVDGLDEGGAADAGEGKSTEGEAEMAEGKISA